MMKFKKASAYKNSKLSIVVFGDPGSGKSTLPTTIKEKTLIVDGEHGLQSINDTEIDVFPLYEDTEGKPIARENRFDYLLKFLDYVQKGGLKEQEFKWIVIDSVTEVAQNLVEGLKKKYPDKKDSMNLWGEYNDKITKFLKDLRDLQGFNILCLSLVDSSKNEDGGKDIAIDMQGKISQRLPAIFDEVFYLYVKPDETRNLVTRSHKNVIAKDRSGKLDKFEPADIQFVADKIRAVKKK